VYLLDNRFSDTNQLMIKSLINVQDEQVLGAQPESDVDDVLFLDEEPRAYASYYEKKKWHVLDESVQGDIRFLEERLGSGFEVISASREGSFWTVSNSLPDKGGGFWLYERKSQNLCSLHSSQSDVSTSFAKMYPMIVESRDGKKLVCYYTLPKGDDKEG